MKVMLPENNYEAIERIFNDLLDQQIRYIKKTNNPYSETPDNFLCFPIWLYKYYKEHYKGNCRIAEEKILSLIWSSINQINKSKPAEIVIKLLKENTNFNDTLILLFARKQLQNEVYQVNQKLKTLKKRETSFRKTILDKNTYKVVLSSLENKIKKLNYNIVNFNFEILVDFEEMPNEVSTYWFLNALLNSLIFKKSKHIKENKNDTNLQDLEVKNLKMQEHEKTTSTDLQIEKQEINILSLEDPEEVNNKLEIEELRESLKDQMKLLIVSFLESIFEKDAQKDFKFSILDLLDVLNEKMINLLEFVLLNKPDKFWQELLISDPNNEQQLNWNHIQKEYISIQRIFISENHLKDFCKIIFKMPEVMEQISSLTTYMLEMREGSTCTTNKNLQKETLQMIDSEVKKEIKFSSIQQINCFNKNEDTMDQKINLKKSLDSLVKKKDENHDKENEIIELSNMSDSSFNVNNYPTNENEESRNTTFNIDDFNFSKDNEYDFNNELTDVGTKDLDYTNIHSHNPCQNIHKSVSNKPDSKEEVENEQELVFNMTENNLENIQKEKLYRQLEQISFNFEN